MQRRKIRAPNVGRTSRRKLLMPGWAGTLSHSEVVFIRGQLDRSPRLRRKWGYMESPLGQMSIPAATIRRIAQHGVL